MDVNMLPTKKNFTKVSNKILDALMPMMTPYEVVVLLFIIRRTHGFNRVDVRLSTSAIQKGTGLSKDGISKAIKALIEYGFITKNGSNQKGTVYALNDTVNIGALRARHQEKKRKIKSKMKGVRADDAQEAKPVPDQHVLDDAIIRLADDDSDDDINDYRKYVTGEWADYIES
jgi:phage replication O-like protein O